MGQPIRRVQAVWEGLSGAPYLTTWYFAFVVGQQNATQTAVKAFLTTITNYVAGSLNVTLQPDQAIIDAGTGDLVSVESATADSPRGAAGTGEVLPPANQGVLRLRTDGVVNNHRVRGRIFLPSPPENLSTGVPMSLYIDPINTAAATLKTATSSSGPWGIWSRPVDADHATDRSPVREGTFHLITTGTVWNKWGIQRGRRD